MAELKAAGVHAEGDERNPLFTLAAQQWKQLPEGERQERVAKHKAGDVNCSFVEKSSFIVALGCSDSAACSDQMHERGALPHHRRSPCTYLQRLHVQSQATCTMWISRVGRQGSLRRLGLVWLACSACSSGSDCLQAAQTSCIACMSGHLAVHSTYSSSMSGWQQSNRHDVSIFLACCCRLPLLRCVTHLLPERSPVRNQCPVMAWPDTNGMPRHCLCCAVFAMLQNM